MSHNSGGDDKADPEADIPEVARPDTPEPRRSRSRRRATQPSASLQEAMQLINQPDRGLHEAARLFTQSPPGFLEAIRLLTQPNPGLQEAMRVLSQPNAGLQEATRAFTQPNTRLQEAMRRFAQPNADLLGAKGLATLYRSALMVAGMQPSVLAASLNAAPSLVGTVGIALATSRTFADAASKQLRHVQKSKKARDALVAEATETGATVASTMSGSGDQTADYLVEALTQAVEASEQRILEKLSSSDRSALARDIMLAVIQILFAIWLSTHHVPADPAADLPPTVIQTNHPSVALPSSTTTPPPRRKPAHLRGPARLPRSPSRPRPRHNP